MTYSFIADNSTESQRTLRLSVLSFAWHVASPAAGFVFVFEFAFAWHIASPAAGCSSVFVFVFVFKYVYVFLLVFLPVFIYQEPTNIASQHSQFWLACSKQSCRLYLWIFCIILICIWYLHFYPYLYLYCSDLDIHFASVILNFLPQGPLVPGCMTLEATTLFSRSALASS